MHLKYVLIIIQVSVSVTLKIKKIQTFYYTF